MSTESILADGQREDPYERYFEEHCVMGEEADAIIKAIEQAVLQSLATDPDRIEAAAKMLSRCFDYPWGLMASQGHDSMREYARATINAAMEKKA